MREGSATWNAHLASQPIAALNTTMMPIASTKLLALIGGSRLSELTFKYSSINYKSERAKMLRGFGDAAHIIKRRGFW